MKGLKCAALSTLLILLNGCGNGLSDVQLRNAKSMISSSIYAEHMDKEYTALAKKMKDDQESGESRSIIPLPYSLEIEIIERCKDKLSLLEDDLENASSFLEPSRYELSPTSNIDKAPFKQCIAHELNTIELDAVNLDNLINNSDFLEMKKQPEFDRKLQDIKQDGKISLHETFEILSIMHNHEKKAAKQDYYSKVEEL